MQYSALDADIRHLDVIVVQDAVAATHDGLANAAPQMMERNMGADVIRVDQVEL